VPRLLAIAARHAGDLQEARRHVERALRLTEREGLRAEQAKVLVEVAWLEATAGRRDAAAAVLDHPPCGDRREEVSTRSYRDVSHGFIVTGCHGE
jgi:hypothetical protein